MTYMALWLGWKAGTVSDADIITRMHVDPFFKAWFQKRHAALTAARQAGDRRRTGPQVDRRVNGS